MMFPVFSLWLILSFAVMLGILTTTLSDARRADPQPAYIGYIASLNGASHLHVMAADGSGAHRLNVPGDVRRFAWMSDMSLAVETSVAADNLIYHLNLNGRARLISPATGFFIAPSPAPAGDWLAFLWVEGQEHYLYRVRADGSELAQVAPNILHAYPPVWVEDWLYFFGFENSRVELLRARFDGQGEVEQVTDMESLWYLNRVEGGVSFAHLNEGRWDVYVLSHPEPDVQPLTQTPYDEFSAWQIGESWVYVANPEGFTQLYQQTPEAETPLPLLPGVSLALDAQNTLPDWSEAGAVLSLYPTDAPVGGLVSEDIYHLWPDSESEGWAYQRLTDTPANESMPRWSPVIDLPFSPTPLLAGAGFLLLLGFIPLARKTSQKSPR